MISAGIQGIYHFARMVASVETVAEQSLLSYDTTFKIGDFYVSIFMFRAAIFVGNPVIPLGYLVHDLKHKDIHKRNIDEVITRLNLRKMIPTTFDAEFINLPLEDIKKISCHRHVDQNLKYYCMKKLKLDARQRNKFRQDHKEIVRQKSREDSLLLFHNYNSSWRMLFRKYDEKIVFLSGIICVSGQLEIHSIGLMSME